MFTHTVAVKGRFRLQVKKENDNSIVKDTEWFDNLVLNQGLDLMGTATNWMAGVKIGTGGSVPVVTQVELDNTVASSTTVVTGTQQSGVSATTPVYAYLRKTFRFNAGVLANVTLSEVAIHTNATNTPIWNRALIKDSQGNPTSITVLDGEYLDVLCEIQCYRNEGDVTGSFPVYDKNNNLVKTVGYTSRAAQIATDSTYNLGGNLGNGSFIGYSNGDLGINTASPTGSTRWSNSGTGVAHAPQTYIAGSYQRVHKYTLAVATGNDYAVNLFRFNTALGAFQVLLSEPITKSSTQTLELLWAIKWHRKV